MSNIKYLDFAFETTADTIDIGAFTEKEALEFIITGMKGYCKRNGYDFSDEEIRERAAKGIAELNKADADFDDKHRFDSANAPVAQTREDLLNYAFETVQNTLNLGAFSDADALNYVITGMKGYAQRAGYDFTDEEIIEKAAAGIKELRHASADFDEKNRLDSANPPVETSKEEYLQYAFDYVANTLDLGAFPEADAVKYAIVGMKAYAYDNGHDFSEEEIREKAASSVKALSEAGADFKVQDWSMPR